MRRLKLRHPQAEPLDEAPPGESFVTAIDSALTFAVSRELFTGDQVDSMLTMMRLAAGPARYEPAPDPVEDVAAAFAGRALIASGELVDGLLDLRLRAARADGAALRSETATVDEQSLICT